MTSAAIATTISPIGLASSSASRIFCAAACARVAIVAPSVSTSNSLVALAASSVYFADSATDSALILTAAV